MVNSSYRKLLVICIFQEGYSYNVLLCMKDGFKWQGICFIKHKAVSVADLNLQGFDACSP